MELHWLSGQFGDNWHLKNIEYSYFKGIFLHLKKAELLINKVCTTRDG